MQARRITVASLTLAGLCVSLCGPVRAQQQPTQGSYQPQPATDPAQTAQAYPGQAYQPQPYQPQPYQPQPYQPQPYQPQPYQSQPYQPQPYQPQPYQPQPYQPSTPQPYYPAQPYPGTQPTFVQPTRTAVRYVNRPRRGLIIAGAVTLGVSWSLTALAAASSGPSDYYYTDYYDGTTSYSQSSLGNASALWPLYIPVLGPWIEMGFLSGSGAPLGGALLAFDGLVQAGGLAMLIAGAVTRTKVAIYARNNLQISPLTLSGGSGILVGGRF